MFNTEKTRACLRGLIGWENHYDLNEIPEFVDTSMSETESGEYYQEKHPALRLDLIKVTLPETRDLEEYLKKVEDSAITEMLNDVMIEKIVNKVGSDLVTNDVIYNSEGGFVNDLIINEGKFVGVRFRPVHSIGVKAQINRIALQLTQAQTGLKLYLFHSHKAKKIAEIEYTTTQGMQFNWIQADLELHADDADLSGGSFYLGYYQSDLSGQAIKYDKLNWRTGYCRGCDGGTRQAKYSAISKYVDMQAFYVAPQNLSADPEEMFDPEAIIETDDNNWGFNFNVSVKCDLSNFVCDNRMTMKYALELKVTYKILKDMSYSMEINHIEEQLKMMIIRDLEGDKETKYVNLPTKYERAIKSMRLDHGKVSSVCLPCSTNSGVTYGVV